MCRRFESCQARFLNPLENVREGWNLLFGSHSYYSFLYSHEISITLDTNSHVLPDLQEKAVEAMEDVLRDD